MAIVKRSTLPKILLIIIALACIPLIISVVRMGYSIVFDFDELNHAQIVWLIAHGQQPYRDIYNSFYPPIFEWTLLPVFLIFGFSFGAIYMARYFMILLFAVRVLAMFIVVKNIFSRRVAVFSVVMFLLDPFVVFSSMQIRPDNLMITAFTLALIPFTQAMKTFSPKWWFWTGIGVAFSLLALPKLLPMVAIFIVGAGVFVWVKKKTLVPLGWAFAGALVPVGLFSLYLLVHGSFVEMFRQTVLEAKAAYSYFSGTMPEGFFYRPDNALIYGTMGKPLTWCYAWFLRIAPITGVIFTIAMTLIDLRRLTAAAMIRLLLCAGLLVQWGILFFVPMVFLQHYIPISWLLAVFTAVGINEFFTIVQQHEIATHVMQIILFIACLALIWASIGANNIRDNANMADLRSIIEKRWSQIPPGTYTFPNFLFRPSAYPITYMYFLGNVPPVILNRLPPIPQRLEQYHVKILIINDYLMSKLSPDVVSYIQSHYRRVEGDDEIMVRN